MHVTVHAITSGNKDGWVMEVAKHTIRTGISERGQGTNDALYSAMEYLYNKDINYINIFTTNRETYVHEDFISRFSPISWNYISANQVRPELRQKLYEKLWK